ncbi:hypothetical protein PCASD_03768 [Puccinia coronata f. sp. avenae]|uniref:Uncharacterized protein n=1 Tax=Puccinia coronata f. sp. avenae TaxID=200324 RepID=A0A2N5V897_9BASI|nr:hypothetical protein PCASD_03768 [Puccinia coronata f. sp. avenae]
MKSVMIAASLIALLSIFDGVLGAPAPIGMGAMPLTAIDEAEERNSQRPTHHDGHVNETGESNTWYYDFS